MNLNDLSAACPGVDFSVPYKSYTTSFSIGDYVIKYLQKTFEIIKSSPDILNFTIVEFVKAEIKDHHLPYSKEYLTQNLKCTDTAAEDFLLAQSAFLALSFEPKEYKVLGPRDFTPFVVDARTGPRKVGSVMIEKVFEGDKAFARKTINNNDDVQDIIMERNILRLATDTGNPHLLHLRCAYEQNERTCLVMHPWCELDLSTFLENPRDMKWWTQRSAHEKLILMTNWMACLASGLSALHKQKIRHQDLKPENVLLDANLFPVICNFGISKTFGRKAKSVKFQDTPSYLPPEHFNENFGRKGDIFSLGLVFVEFALFLYGQKSLKKQFTNGCYRDITNSLDTFLAKKFPIFDDSMMDDWNNRFQSLVRRMLDVTPENRPKASEVWEKVNAMVESLGAKPHCEAILPLGPIPRDHEELEDDTEPIFIENSFDRADNEVW